MVAPHRFRRNYKFLKELKKAKKVKRRQLLESAPKDSILCLCDCANNILRGNVPLKLREKKCLSHHKSTLRALASGKRSKDIKKKRKLLIQKGGFLPMLLAPILSVASGLLGNLLSRKSA